MVRCGISKAVFTLAVCAAATASFAAQPGTNGEDDKYIDIRTSGGDLHAGNDADAHKIGLPLYPGAQLRAENASRNHANLSISTENFGFTLIVANYDSEDSPDKVIQFYRNKLKKYGKVLECHTNQRGGDVDAHAGDSDSAEGKELKCDENNGPVVELKAGTKDDQHIVAIEPKDDHGGTTFAMVYIQTHGKQGDI